MFEGLGLLQTRLIHNFPLWQLYSWLETCFILNFPPFFIIFAKFRTEKKFGDFFSAKPRKQSPPDFRRESKGIRLLWRESNRSWPLRRGFVPNRRRPSDLDRPAGLKRPFEWKYLRNCELNFNFRGKSWGIENHTCFISHEFCYISRFSILTAGKSFVGIPANGTVQHGTIYRALCRQRWSS